MNTDDSWEEWGRREPYFGVITQAKFRRAELSNEALTEFFESGVRHVDYVLQAIRQHVDPAFLPASALDFGCGVGRVVIPLAAVAGRVTGADVSPSMLAEARTNCARRGLANVELIQSDDLLSTVAGNFDLIHSFIVFQHIPVERGRMIFGNLLRRLNPGGVAAVHFTYAKSAHAGSYGAPPPAPAAQAGKSTAQAAPGADPEMLMLPYNLNDLFFLAQVAGVPEMRVQFTDHGGELGVFLFFRAPKP